VPRELKALLVSPQVEESTEEMILKIKTAREREKENRIAYILNSIHVLKSLWESYGYEGVTKLILVCAIQFRD